MEPNHVLYPILAFLFAISCILPVALSFRQKNNPYKRADDTKKLKRSTSTSSVAQKERFEALFSDPQTREAFKEYKISPFLIEHFCSFLSLSLPPPWFPIETFCSFPSFPSYCVKRWCIEAFTFYAETLEFKKCSPEEKLEKAKYINEKFLKANSPFEVNIDEETKDELVKRIEEKQIDVFLFSKAENEVGHFLRHGVFPDWVALHAFAADSSTLESPTRSVPDADFHLERFHNEISSH